MTARWVRGQGIEPQAARSNASSTVLTTRSAGTSTCPTPGHPHAARHLRKGALRDRNGYPARADDRLLFSLCQGHRALVSGRGRIRAGTYPTRLLVGLRYHDAEAQAVRLRRTGSGRPPPTPCVEMTSSPAWLRAHVRFGTARDRRPRGRALYGEDDSTGGRETTADRR